MSGRAPLPEALTRPDPGPVLALAPHADDDVIGCGGTLGLHREQGDPVHVLIAFDGVKGDAGGEHDPGEYRARRRDEALRAGAHLGLSDYEFWDYPEGHEPAGHELVGVARRLARRIGELGPATVYAPWLGEQHVDHHVLARVVRLALVVAGFRGRAWGYEVWTPLIPTRVVDISALFERKKRALQEHASQLELRDILHKGLAITAQRAMYLSPEARHGEAFAPLGGPSDADRALLE